VEASLTKQLQLPDVEDEFHGYLFWNKLLSVNNEKVDVYYASGNDH
jgi:hypothetical protein